MRVRNVVALGLLAASFGALYPGLTKPLLTITAKINFLGVDRELFRETRSILETVRSLRDSGNELVAAMIFGFGVVVPVVKGILIGIALAVPSETPRHRIDGFARGISKWAMNDVFVVAVYVTFLSAKATDALDATIEPGFWWFTAYVLLSLIALQFLRLGSDPRPR